MEILSLTEFRNKYPHQKPPVIETDLKAIFPVDENLVVKFFKRNKDFLMELRYTLIFNHPHIAKAISCTQSRRLLFWRYTDILSAIKNSSISIVDVISQITHTLHYFHKHGYAFLNLSLEHIMYNRQTGTIVFTGLNQIRKCRKYRDKFYIPVKEEETCLMPLGYSKFLCCGQYLSLDIEIHCLGMLIYYLIRGYPPTLAEYQQTLRDGKPEIKFCTSELQIFFEDCIKCKPEIFKSEYLLPDMYCDLEFPELMPKTKILTDSEYSEYVDLARSLILTSIHEKIPAEYVFNVLHIFRTTFGVFSKSVGEYFKMCRYLPLLLNKISIITEIPNFEDLITVFESAYDISYSFDEMIFHKYEQELLIHYYLSREFDANWCIANPNQVMVPLKDKAKIFDYTPKLEKLLYASDYPPADLVFEVKPCSTLQI